MYYLDLTNAELETLAWLTNRGYFPAELYDDLALAPGQPDDAPARDVERRWECSEAAAWSLLALQEDDPDAYLSCLEEPLLGKILALENEIV